ncbi:MAG TPA: transcription-repair coupling factor [Gammaproteobacteria bacterium]|nr:transcription-repair coupling factor [Gammaproteobacteria bacterium]
MPVAKLNDPALPRSGQRIAWQGLYGSAAALALAHAARKAGGPLLVIARSAREADRLDAALRYFLGDSTLPVLHFRDRETLPYDIFSSHQDIVSDRLSALFALSQLERGIVLAAAPTLLERLPPKPYVATNSLVLEVGQKLDPETLRARLETAGYRCVSQVMEHGEFAVRGALIDLFPMGSEAPYRLDLFDDELDTLRTFDPENQLSLDKLERVRLLPAREFPLDEDGIRGFRQRYRSRFEGDPQRSQIYRDISNGIAPGGIEYYLPLFFDETCHLGDYLPTNAVVATMEGVETVLQQTWEQIGQRFEQRGHDIERPLLPPAEAFVAPGVLQAEFAGRATIQIFETASAGDAVEYQSEAPPSLLVDTRAEEPLRALLSFAAENPDTRILFAVESAGHRESLANLLRRRDITPRQTASWTDFVRGDARFNLAVTPLEKGLVLPDVDLAVITEDQLFGERVSQRRQRRVGRDPDKIIRDLTDLSVGAPVVHEDHGVGRYLGLQTIAVSDVETEFLTLEYAGGDKLYVPVAQLHLISRYTGGSPESAPLHKLGGDQWSKAKRRAAEQARDVAAELLDVYARRAAHTGHAFKIDDADYRTFASAFPFEETPDQLTAIEQVRNDMHSPRAMDRVVCGDVGFGKTEVAVRAAFIAVQDGKQVAVLAPTTLLAQQHFQTFQDRFADWPVRVEVMSRFRNAAAQNKVADSLEGGDVDIVVGTHALLKDRLKFKNLGLVIIDEEQRFGVRHKEKLKSLRAEVDVLTLTATPIPRTLNMALAGIRDLSIIATPPAERLAVKTFVNQWNDALVVEACTREIKRGGQVFFVHNKVETIEKAARNLRELVPEAEVRVAHGQMRERELEQVMLDFYHRRFNVLVCSTIIENGIDVPTANTIIIDRADHFGLAQLHQLRGRVGRSHHRAYAYMLTPPRKLMTPDAVKRLDAIASLDELGAGFTLATHDLEIRGAGELLGAEQSGQIHEVGFSLYTDLLDRAVKALKSGKIPELEQPLHREAEIDLGIPALLPADYMPDVHMRLVLYKRIAGAETATELDDLQVEMIDRFGLLPDAAKNLFRLAELRLKAKPIGIRKIEAGGQSGRLLFEPQPAVDPQTVLRLVQEQPKKYKLQGGDQLRFTQSMPEPADRVAAVEALLERLELRQAA